MARATNAAAEAKEAAQRGLDENTSAFIAWCESYGIEYDDMDDYDGTIDLGQVDDESRVKQILQEGYRLWQKMNRDPATFTSATVKYELYEDNSTQFHSDILNDSSQTESGSYQQRYIKHAWHKLRHTRR